MLDKSIDDFSNNFCSVPWLQIHTEPDGTVTPCCYYSLDKTYELGNWKTEKIVDIFNKDRWNKLRKDFLEGHKPVACDRCWKEENKGVKSMRQTFNERYQNLHDYADENYYNKYFDIIKNSNADGSVNDIKLSTIDLIFNNLCNLKCRTCGPGLSTSWAVETIKLGRTDESFQSLLTNQTISHMKDDLHSLVDMVDAYTEIHFSGGEPMVQEEHYELLCLLIDKNKTNIKIRYNTNLTTYTLKHYNVFELLSNFKNVFIVGSIDAMGKKGEYIRKGFDWQKALEWIHISKTFLPNAHYAISAVYSLYNALEAIELHRYMCENKIFQHNSGHKFSFYLNVLHNPIWLQTTVLPSDYKQHVTQKIKDHMQWLEETQIHNFAYNVSKQHWQNAINYMNSVDETKNIPDFYRETNIIDNIRNEKFEDVFPELHEILKIYDK